MEIKPKPNDPDVYVPEDPTIRIWRYMDLPKYLHLLHYKQLFFVRADKLEDRFEGSWPVLDKEKNIKYWRSFKSADPPLGAEQVEKLIREDEILNKNRQKDTFISCWHVNEYESLAMWKVYGESNKSIAIQSTFERLENTINRRASIGLVEYIDYNSDSLFANKKFGACPYNFKRNSFKYENEIRCIYQRVRPGVQDPNMIYNDKETGIPLNIDVGKLITRAICALCNFNDSNGIERS